MQSQYPVVEAVLIGTKAIGNLSSGRYRSNHTDARIQVQGC